MNGNVKQAACGGSQWRMSPIFFTYCHTDQVARVAVSTAHICAPTRNIVAINSVTSNKMHLNASFPAKVFTFFQKNSNKQLWIREGEKCQCLRCQFAVVD